MFDNANTVCATITHEKRVVRFEVELTLRVVDAISYSSIINNAIGPLISRQMFLSSHHRRELLAT